MKGKPQNPDHAVARAARIFAELKRCAEAGEPCPCNEALAADNGCGKTHVINILNLLIVAGMIEIERGNRDRIVTICATGKKTAGTIKARHHSARYNTMPMEVVA